MLALACAFPADNLHAIDLPYRLSSWALDQADSVALWRGHDGRLVGWAVMQTPFWAIDYATHPAAGPGLHSHVLAWADGRARQIVNTSSGRPCWFVHLFADQADRIQDLEQAGFACQAEVGQDSWSRVLLLHRFQRPVPKGPVPAGYAIRPLAGEGEAGAYVALHRAAFETRNMTAAWRTRTLSQPEYVPDLDLVAVDPDGRAKQVGDAMAARARCPTRRRLAACTGLPELAVPAGLGYA